MYRVTTYFIDLQDGEHPYHVGDAFPREGHTVSENRIAELSGNKNKRKMPLIEEVPEPTKEPAKPKEAPKKETRSDRSRPAGNAKSKSGKKKQN